MDVIEVLRKIALTTALVTLAVALGAPVVAGQDGTPATSRTLCPEVNSSGWRSRGR